MNKFNITLLMLLFSMNILAQSGPVILNFSRPKNIIGESSSIKILINDQHIGDIENGSTFTYKLVFSGKGNIKVLVNSSVYTKTINVAIVSGSTYSFETGFTESGVYLLVIENSAFEKQKLAILSQQQAIAKETKTNPVTSQKSTSQIDVNRKDLSVSIKTQKELDSEAIRQEWLSKGGGLISTSLVAGISGMGQNTEMYDLAGVGLNLALSQNFLNLQMPEYKEGKSNWKTYHFGYGLSGSYGVQTIHYPLAYSEYLESSETTNLQININLNAGITFGKGRYLDRTNWRGWAIELNYKPTLVIMKPSEGKSTTDFNFVGFSIDFNRCNFTSTMNKIAPKAQLKMSVFFLPPINNMPFVVSISVGALVYSKR